MPSDAASTSGSPPADYEPWLGHWVQSRFEETVLEKVLGDKGFPYPLRKIIMSSIAERKFHVQQRGSNSRSRRVLACPPITRVSSSPNTAVRRKRQCGDGDQFGVRG